MDIVVKLFVLAQLRALALNKERITVGLLQQVYQDELKPVHPMLDALRSGIPERIARYSDLMLPEIDKRLIQLQQDIAAMTDRTPEELVLNDLATDDERRIYLMLKDDYDSKLLFATVRKAFSENPTLTRQRLLPIILNWLAEEIQPVSEKTKKNRLGAKVVKFENWDSLPNDDLRFIKSQQVSAKAVHNALKNTGMLLDLREYFGKAS
jgi:hypothetical protein